jgi:hypothetical protein
VVVLATPSQASLAPRFALLVTEHGRGPRTGAVQVQASRRGEALRDEASTRQSQSQSQSARRDETRLLLASPYSY